LRAIVSSDVPTEFREVAELVAMNCILDDA
jgi:hypothetical protein